MVWKENKNGNFMGKSIFDILKPRSEALGTLGCLLKWGFFVWEDSCAKVLTLDR